MSYGFNPAKGEATQAARNARKVLAGKAADGGREVLGSEAESPQEPQAVSWWLFGWQEPHEGGPKFSKLAWFLNPPPGPQCSSPKVTAAPS